MRFLIRRSLLLVLVMTGCGGATPGGTDLAIVPSPDLKASTPDLTTLGADLTMSMGDDSGVDLSVAPIDQTAGNLDQSVMLPDQSVTPSDQSVMTTSDMVSATNDMTIVQDLTPAGDLLMGPTTCVFGTSTFNNCVFGN